MSRLASGRLARQFSEAESLASRSAAQHATQLESSRAGLPDQAQCPASHDKFASTVAPEIKLMTSRSPKAARGS
jgi:hypothetical protein